VQKSANKASFSGEVSPQKKTYFGRSDSRHFGEGGCYNQYDTACCLRYTAVSIRCLSANELHVTDVLGKAVFSLLITKSSDFCGIWNVHCHIHKSPPLIPVLNQINSVHIVTPCLFKIHFNTTVQSAFRSTRYCIHFFLHSLPIPYSLIPSS
jgi:hypothetical protein